MNREGKCDFLMYAFYKKIETESVRESLRVIQEPRGRIAGFLYE